jgi:hypothetical protein
MISSVACLWHSVPDRFSLRSKDALMTVVCWYAGLHSMSKCVSVTMPEAHAHSSTHLPCMLGQKMR